MVGRESTETLGELIAQIAIPLLSILAFLVFYLSFLEARESNIDVAGSVEKVVAVHGDVPYSIVTVDGEEYRYEGEVVPEKGDEILFTTREDVFSEPDRMTEWHLAD